MSPASCPARTCRAIAQSSTERVSGPGWSSEYSRGKMPSRLARPCVGFKPTTPHRAAGMRTEPPLSVPTEGGTRPAAPMAPEPLLEPPGEYAVFHGLRILPKSGLSPDSPSANLFMFALPTMTAPAALRRFTTPASVVGTFVTGDLAPAVV